MDAWQYILALQLWFIEIDFWDILDILITAYLIFTVYRLLRGSVAINIFIGVILLYAIWWLVQTLDMDLLSQLLGQFVSVGVIILIIIFQPEIRRFLLLLGNSTIRRRSTILSRVFGSNVTGTEAYTAEINAIKSALVRLGKKRTGALIVLTDRFHLNSLLNSGTTIDAKISQPLLESMFHKESPLHDGAVIISDERIQIASAILPVSENQSLPKNVGLRHRAAVGVTENTRAIALIASEENGTLSYAKEGRLVRKLTEEELYELIHSYFTDNE